MMIRKCKTKGAFEALLDRPINLNLDKIKSKFESIADLPILIIVKVDGTEVTCYKNGKLIIKNNNQDEAYKIAEKIYEIAK